MRGGFLLEDGRVAEDAVADAAELVVYGLADGLAVVVSGQRFSEFAPFETEFADFIGQIAAFGERLFDNAELVPPLKSFSSENHIRIPHCIGYGPQRVPVRRRENTFRDSSARPVLSKNA